MYWLTISIRCSRLLLPLNLILGYKTDNEGSITGILAVGTRNGHTGELRIFIRLSQLATGRASSNDLNFGTSETAPLFWGVCIDLSNNRPFFHPQENTTSRVLVFETGLEGYCNINDNLDGIFLWIRVRPFFLFFSIFISVKFRRDSARPQSVV